MSPPLVSAIILAYKQPAYLNAALASVASQNYSHIEILVIDDASGPEFISQYRLPPNARLILNDCNTAFAAINRNRAIQQSTGEFLAFLDQDDLWLSEKLSIQLAALQNSPKALIHFTGHQPIDYQGHALPGQVAPELPHDPLPSLIRRNTIPYSSVMLRRAALEIVGLFDEAIRGAADWDYWLRTAAAGSILLDPRPLLLRRKHPDQWSRSSLVVAQGSLEVLTKATHWLAEKHPDLVPLAHRRRARWLREIARAHLDAGGDPAACMTFLRDSARIFPFDPRTYALAVRTLCQRIIPKGTARAGTPV